MDKDPQAQLLYDFELDHLMALQRFPDSRAVRRWLLPIWTAESQRYGTKARMPSIRVNKHTRDNTVAEARTFANRIVLSEHGLPAWVILHEASHLLVEPLSLTKPRKYESHGPEFCGVYFGLLERHYGCKANVLAWLARSKGLRVDARWFEGKPVEGG